MGLFRNVGLGAGSQKDQGYVGAGGDAGGFRGLASAEVNTVGESEGRPGSRTLCDSSAPASLAENAVGFLRLGLLLEQTCNPDRVAPLSGRFC